MRAGQLRHWVTIQEPTKVADGLGGYTTTWADVLTTNASINALKIRESPDEGKAFVRGMYLFRIRYDAANTITHDMRISFDSRTFEIRAIENMGERDIYLEITAEELDVN